MRRAALRWGPPLLWAVAIFSVSARSTVPHLPSLLGWDKLQHATAYALGGALLARALAGTRRGAIFATALGLLYGASDEVHQRFVPGRNSSAWDWLADAVGVLAGVALWRLYLLHLERRARRRAPAREARAAVTHA